MNLLLLSPEDFISADRARISGRRLQHLHDVHRAQVGDDLRAGLVNGCMGSARIEQLDQETTELQVELNEPPPPPLPVTLLLALPRPKMLNRILQAVTSLGVKRIVLLNCLRVEKSYWQSPHLQADNIHEQLLLGLEQARDTVLPEVQLRKRFKPFVEDELPALTQDHLCLLAHPGEYPHVPRLENQTSPVALAVGPEGGFIPYEVEKLIAAGFQAHAFGERILRVETAVTALLARLFM